MLTRLCNFTTKRKAWKFKTISKLWECWSNTYRCYRMNCGGCADSDVFRKASLSSPEAAVKTAEVIFKYLPIKIASSMYYLETRKYGGTSVLHVMGTALANDLQYLEAESWYSDRYSYNHYNSLWWVFLIDCRAWEPSNLRTWQSQVREGRPAVGVSGKIYFFPRPRRKVSGNS